MPFKQNNRYLLRIYYYDCRISLEAHHSLGDGTGGMFLLQTITAEYLKLLGFPVSCGGFVLDIHEKPDPEELEDAYMRYASATVCPPRPSEKTYRVRGTKEPFYTLNIINGILSASEVKKAAKQYGVTITEYLNAVLLYALLQKQSRETSAGQDRHAGESAKILSVPDTAELYHHDLPFRRSQVGNLELRGDRPACP